MLRLYLVTYAFVKKKGFQLCPEKQAVLGLQRYVACQLPLCILRQCQRQPTPNFWQCCLEAGSVKLQRSNQTASLRVGIVICSHM